MTNQETDKTTTSTEHQTQPRNFDPKNMDELIALSNWLSKSGLLPPALRGKPADIGVVLMTGAELGITSTQALRLIHVIGGRPVLAADLIVGLVIRSPHCEHFSLVESTGERATYETQRRGNPKPIRLTYTLAQAKAAHLTAKEVWTSHPDAMLRARCSAALARVAYPDVAAGLYETDEGEEIRGRPPAPPHVRLARAPNGDEYNTTTGEIVSDGVGPVGPEHISAATPTHKEPEGLLPAVTGTQRPETEDDSVDLLRREAATCTDQQSLTKLQLKYHRIYPQGHQLREAALLVCSVQANAIRARGDK